MKKSQDVRMLTAERKRKRDRTAFVPETIPALFLLSGILFAFRDMMYGNFCLLGALLTGWLVILALQITEPYPRVSKYVKAGIYVMSIFCFLGLILYVSQGLLDTVNRFMVLWNLRFRMEMEQFSVNSRAVIGSLLFWCLVSVLLGVVLLIAVKKRNVGGALSFVVCGFLVGFVLGRSSMWMSVVCLLAGCFGMLIFSAAPGRQHGVGEMMCLTVMCMAFGILLFLTGGYQGLSQIAQWRADAVAQFERFRYGEDTLPKGELKKAQELLEGEEETLMIDMEEPGEWYLKGFVGGVYDKDRWQELPMEAYHGEYEGLLQWLETKAFSVLTQYACYQKLEDEAEGLDTKSVKVKVTNKGAYRKFVYLPSWAEQWSGGGAKEQKDWQVRSGKFFGAEEYEFQAVDGFPSAEEIQPGLWARNPSREEEETYLGAESVYRSFVEEYYMEVDDELKQLINDMFFEEEEEKDLYHVTAKIRKTLRQETGYTENPPAAPAGKDFVEWFLTEAKRGNAVHFASAAVLAYRTAGYAARYAEGYHYPEEESQKLFEEGKTVGELTNKNAHAWAEVYVPGVGWLPVEVVPGMYTELYTNQVVEGAPSYQVNGDPGDEGIEMEGGKGSENEKKEAEKKPLTFQRVLTILLFGLYVCFFLFLIMEIQRETRRGFRKRIVAEGGDQAFVEHYVKGVRQLFLIGKVIGDYDRPMELSFQVEEKMHGISREEYERAIQLVQKVRFGGKQLLPYEIHTLECFREKFLKTMFHKKGLWGKMKIRYWYGL